MLTDREIIENFGGDEDFFVCAKYALLHGAKKIYAEKDGLLLFYGGVYNLFGTSGKGIENALACVDKANCFVCSTEEECSAVMNKFGFKKSKPCYQIWYKKPFGVKIPENTEVKRLEPTDQNIDFVTDTYTLGFSRESIKALMTDFEFYATYTDGEISGYIGRHDEGSIGILEIMPKFRRRGLGAFLVDYSVQKVIENGDLAYCHIVKDNTGSLNMHLKMNFTPSNKLVWWCS
ncbi:MAG: GNAT family N-acetyltransferase [Clostridiales bacterium]|nr:GNAT family N-acetyltransferase [Clostridiales bacterium]